MALGGYLYPYYWFPLLGFRFYRGIYIVTLMIGTVLRAHSVDYTYGPLLGSNDSAHLFAEIP